MGSELFETWVWYVYCLQLIFNEAKLWFPENVTHIDIKITLVDMS